MSNVIARCKYDRHVCVLLQIDEENKASEDDWNKEELAESRKREEEEHEEEMEFERQMRKEEEERLVRIILINILLSE